MLKSQPMKNFEQGIDNSIEWFNENHTLAVSIEL
jgi:dTDP-D-glucose 4,6-dehydratase